MRTRTLIGWCCCGLGWAALANTNPLAPVLFGAAIALFIEELIQLCLK